MKILLFITATASCFKIGRQQASGFLERKRRSSNEETRDDLELECIEKQCTSEEFDEVYDFETGLFKVILTLSNGS